MHSRFPRQFAVPVAFWMGKLHVAVLCLGGGATAVGSAAEPRDSAGPAAVAAPVSEKESTPAAKPQDDLALGPVIPATDLVGTAVSGARGRALGEAEDLILDLETGQVAFVVVALSETQPSAYVAIPARFLRVDEQGVHLTAAPAEAKLDQARRLEANALETVFNRAWAMAEYSTFGEKPYWAAERIAMSSAFDPKDYRLTRLSQAKGKSVESQEGNKIGSIADFAVLPEAMRLAYVVVRRPDDQQHGYPIPLGAFTVPRVQGPWLVDVTEDALDNTPKFKTDAWPRKLDRGWIEFVHVRYGQAALGGVQHERRPTD